MSEVGFTGVWIPREVALNDRLNPLAKILYGVLQSLDDGPSGCWASNEYLARITGCKVRHVQGLLGELIAEGLLTRTETGRGKAKKRSLMTAGTAALKRQTPCTTVHAPMHQSASPPCTTVHTDRIEDRKEDNTPQPPWGARMAKAWDEWVQFRKERKAKLTPISIAKQFTLLAGLSSEDEAVECIQQSIRNGWQGLFPPRQVVIPQRKPLTSEDHKHGF